MVEYRAVPEDDGDAFRGVLDYAFRAEAGPTPDRDDAQDEPAWVGDRRGLYDDGRLVTTAVHHSFTVVVRGRWLEVAGLGGVATRPEDRRRGLVRQLLAESLEEYRERGHAFALLWPFKHGFYQRFGWGRLDPVGRYELEPTALAALADHPGSGGRFEPLDVDDIASLQALDDRFAGRADLAMRRTEEWYRHRFFRSLRGEPFVYGWYRDGDLRGYLRYGVESAGDDDRLDVWEFGAPDGTATVNLLRFLHRHEDQVDRIRLWSRPDDLLFDLVDDPLALDLALLPGPMGRLVDVESGLESLPAPSGVEGTVVVSVADPLADWNDGQFVVEARDGVITVEADEGARPDAALPVETLSRLALGTTTAERAALAGGMDADAEIRALFDALFPRRETFLREFF